MTQKFEAYEFLTDERSGSVSVLRFYSKTLFKSFSEKHLEFKKKSNRNLRYAFLLEEEEGLNPEDVLVMTSEYPEVHIHGGLANKKRIDIFLKKLCVEIHEFDERKALRLSLWEKCFSQCKGSKAIVYMLQVKEDFDKKDEYKNHDQEGYAYIKKIKISLVGSPNTGKSTLFNLLLGQQRALVSPVAGTTRDVLKADILLAGFEAELVDTAGVFDKSVSLDSIHTESQKISKKIIEDSDIVIVFNRESKIDFISLDKQMFVFSKSDIHAYSADKLSFSTQTGQGINTFMKTLEARVCQLKGKIISNKFYSKH